MSYSMQHMWITARSIKFKARFKIQSSYTVPLLLIMQRRDPYSTPARRRRIIAEIAKKTLRSYCVKAVENVIRFRIETKASITIQCSFRCFRARKLVSHLLNIKRGKCATKIQAIVRRKLGRLRVIRLKAEQRRRRQLRLVEVVTNLYNWRKQRMARIALMIAMRLAREKRERLAATNIQRLFRGHQARQIFREMYRAHQQRIRIRNAAATRIQCHVRRYLAVKWYKYWTTRRRSGYIIYRNVMRWWQRRCRRRRSALRMLQRCYRGHRGRLRAQRMYNLREQLRIKESLLLQSMLLNETIHEMLLRVSKELLPIEKSMNIHVDVDSALLRRMTDAGPRLVVQWCLENAILQYRSGGGYSAGAVVQQVVRSVDIALLPLPPPVGSTEKAHNYNNSNGNVLSVDTRNSEGQNTGVISSSTTSATATGEKVIALSKWDGGDAVDVPIALLLPSEWGQQVYEHKQHCKQQKQSPAAGGESKASKNRRSPVKPSVSSPVKQKEPVGGGTATEHAVDSNHKIHQGAGVSVLLGADGSIELHISTTTETAQVPRGSFLVAPAAGAAALPV